MIAKSKTSGFFLNSGIICLVSALCDAAAPRSICRLRQPSRNASYYFLSYQEPTPFFSNSPLHRESLLSNSTPSSYHHPPRLSGSYNHVSTRIWPSRSSPSRGITLPRRPFHILLLLPPSSKHVRTNLHRPPPEAAASRIVSLQPVHSPPACRTEPNRPHLARP